MKVKVIMVPHEVLVSLLCILVCTKQSYQALIVENSCTENIIKDYNSGRDLCRRCGTSYPVISKIISCNNISVYNLKLYEESALSEDEIYSPNYNLTLKVINSGIPVLPISIFKNVKNLTELSLENMKLKTIMSGAFNFLDQLKEIYLGNNELTTISDGIFNTLMVLEILDLSRNRIETVSDHAFVGVKLENLNLSNNNISSLGEMPSSLTHLSVLDMSYNNLKNINSLRDLPLHSLNLSHNNIESVDFEVLQKVSIFFDLSFNNISKIINFNISQANKVKLSHNRISSFVQNNNVTVLDISYNNIPIIGNDLLSENLEEFYISFNFISSLSSDTFFGLYNLTHLYLDNNNISSIPTPCFKDLTSLTHLNLSENKLSSFKFGTLNNLINLQVLDISDNNFKELPQFYSLNGLTYLYIENNEISDIKTYVITQHFKHLVEINLNNNTWSCQRLGIIVHTLKQIRITVPNGNSWEDDNIRGIKCYETPVTISESGINLNDSKLNSFFNEDFTKTILYKYFNQDFKQSEFFKYLEGLKRPTTNSTNAQNVDYTSLNKLLHKATSNSTDFKNSEMYNYFNKDFKNTSFFKYLENLRINTNVPGKLDEDKLEEIASSFKSLAKELEKISNSNKSNEYFGNSDFKTNDSFKYLERYSDITDSTVEKLIDPIKKNEIPNYTGLLSVIAISLLVIMCIMIIILYHQFFGLNKFTLKKEEVELI